MMKPLTALQRITAEAALRPVHKPVHSDVLKLPEDFGDVRTPELVALGKRLAMDAAWLYRIKRSRVVRLPGTVLQFGSAAK